MPSQSATELTRLLHLGPYLDQGSGESANICPLFELPGQLVKSAMLTSQFLNSNIADIIDFTGREPRLKPACDIRESARRALKSVKVECYVERTGDDAREVQLMEFTFWDNPTSQSNARLRAIGELKETVEHSGKKGDPIPHEHTVRPPELSYDEFCALPAEERLRRLRESIAAISRN